jgi:hypothetical protein
MMLKSPLMLSAACLVVGTALAGCSSASDTALTPSNGSSSVEQLSFKAQLLREIPSLALRSRTMPLVRPDRTRSWMARDAASQDLLYVSDDGTFDVYVFSYPAGTLVGTLTGFNTPDGLCTDKAGNVFVTNTGDSNIVEYAHGGTSPIATLSDPDYYPYDCSVDPIHGNLAVANINNGSGSGGNVAIYPHAGGTPKIYSVPNFFTVVFDSYDPSGNLFVWGNGQYSSDYSLFAEMPEGTKQFTGVSLPGSIGVGPVGNNVAWDGEYLTIGGGAYVYQITVSDGAATVVGTTSLVDATGIAQYSVPTTSHKVEQGKVLVGPDCFDSNVKFYHYPAGGQPTKTLTGFDLPYGSVVSKAK